MTTNYRKLTGWMHVDMGIWPRVELWTTLPVDDEVFAALEYVSEVDKVGTQFFKNAGHKTPKRALEVFRAFVRQGKTFYYAAKQLHYRASALLYYYAFLNLTKAYLTIDIDTFSSVAGPITHGLRYKNVIGGVMSQGVWVTKRKGVFHKFYEKETSTQIPMIKLNIANLLGFCTDVAYEYEEGGFGQRKFTPVLIRLFGDDREKVSWPVIAVANFSIIRPYKKALKPFFGYFEQIVPEKELAREAFGIFAEVYSGFTFFQSKQVYSWNKDIIPGRQIKRDLHSALVNLYEPELHDEKVDFYLSAPLRKNLQIPMNQFLAIYAIIFYLGSLVRYNPSYLEKLLNRKDAWIIERFVKSAPETFLRYIANAILQKNYIYKRR